MHIIGKRLTNEHTVIQGDITSITKVNEGYLVEYYKHRNKVNYVSPEFDDMGQSKTFNVYHYNQKSNK